MGRGLAIVSGMLLVVVLASACGSDATESETESDLPPGAAAAVDEYFRAINESDAEGFLAIINPAVYRYGFHGDLSNSADGVDHVVAQGNFIVERHDEIAVQLDHTVANTAYVAISAVRPNTEPLPVNGIMVLELQEYPDNGWLVTLDSRFGL